MGWCRGYHGYYYTDRSDGADTHHPHLPPSSDAQQMEREAFMAAGTESLLSLSCVYFPTSPPGSLFGPLGSGAIDMMHKDTHGYHYMDDTKARVRPSACPYLCPRTIPQ